jgi:beta-N-acetylhexosaminidase
VEGRGGGGTAAGQGSRLRRERERRLREIKRRRRFALLGVAGLAAVVGAVVGAGGGASEPAGPAEAAIPSQCEGSDPEAWARLAGQRIVVRTDGTPDSKLLRRAKAGEIAGVIVFPGTGLSQEQIEDGLDDLQKAAAAGDQPPLIVATDQEGGPVKRFINDPPLRSPYDLGRAGDAGDSRLEGQATGTFLRRAGINTDLAPVLDVPATPDAVMAFRAFGREAEDVSRLGNAFAEGLGQERVLATAKHFPGLGRTVLNTDFSPSEIDASRAELRVDLIPFRDAIDQGIPLVMVASAAYPALGAKGPAVLEPKIVQGLLRGRLGFEGVSISDDLQAGAISSALGTTDAAEQAARAGIDLLLFATDSAPEVHDRLTRALTVAKLDREQARESCVRVVELREGLE